MRKTLGLFLIFFAFGWPLKTFCQVQSKLNWSTDSELLPQNSIKSIAPDKYGYIWLTTENGLIRYDGNEFKVFNNQNIGTNNNRLVYIRGNYKTDSLYTTSALEEDHILIHKRTARKIDPKNHPNSVQFLPEKKWFNSNGIPSILFDNQDRPYKIPLTNGKEYLIEKNTVRLQNAKKVTEFQVDFVFNSNAKFFTIDEKLYYMEPDGSYTIIEKGKVRRGHKVNVEGPVYLIWNIVSRQIFLYTSSSLYLLELKGSKLIPKLLIDQENFDQFNLNAVYFDAATKTVFLGSATKGLCSYKLNMFRTISAPRGSNVFYALTPFSANSVVSPDGSIMNQNGLTGMLDFEFADRYAMLLDKNRDIWLKENSRIYRYTYSSNYKKYDRWDFYHGISTLYMDSEGTIWFDMYQKYGVLGSLNYFKPEKNPVFKKFMDTNFTVKFITEKHKDQLILGTSQGIYYLNPSTRKIQSVTATKKLTIRSVYITDGDHIWLTTYEDGFFLLKNNKLHGFPLDKNKFLATSHCIIEDTNGFLWISTNKGLFQVTKKALLDYAAKKSNDVFYNYFSKESGFLTNEFNGGCQPCGLLLDSTIFLPSINGVVVFDFNQIEAVLPDNNIFIDEMDIDNNVVKVGDTVRLPRNFERASFHISSPYFGNKNNLNFEAKLDGPEKIGWTKLNNNQFTFTNIGHGTYKLTVRKMSGFDAKYTYKELTVVVVPAFWETIWFMILLVLLVVGVVILIDRLRAGYVIRQQILLQKNINEKTLDLKNTISALRSTKENLNSQVAKNTKMIQMITHDIKSPLKFMSMASQYMYDSYDANDPELKENIKAIFTSSSQMYNFAENLLEYSKVYDSENNFESEFNLNEVVGHKIRLFESIADAQKTTIKNQIPADTALQTNKQLFTIIIHNLLDNAIKHTVGGKVIFTANYADGAIQILITDTGTGMDQPTLKFYQSIIDNYDPMKSKTTSRLGLQMVIELLVILNGKIQIESIEGVGTTITLIFNYSDQSSV